MNRARDINNLESMDDLVMSDPSLRGSGVQARARHRVEDGPAPASESDEPALISIGAPADPALLDPTYAYLSAYCFACLPPQQAQRLTVALYELYDNALRYGSDGGEVRLELRRNGQCVSLTVANCAEPAQVERLKAQIGRVQEDASAAFSDEMHRFSDASLPPPMLGIVRVAHEAGLPLELYSYQDRIEVSTRCDE